MNRDRGTSRLGRGLDRSEYICGLGIRAVSGGGLTTGVIGYDGRPEAARTGSVEWKLLMRTIVATWCPFAGMDDGAFKRARTENPDI